MIRCDACNRHIFEAETACPFCTAPRGRLRTGLLAAGLVALAGCPAPVYGAPAEDDLGPDAEVAADAMPTDATPTDAVSVDALPKDMAADAEVDMFVALPPYGIPPTDAMPDVATPADAAPADAAPADAAPADAQVDMFVALPPYGIPPEPERDPE